MSLAPPPASSIAIACAPASRLFSSSSFNAEAGRSTTSPAAIWLTSEPGTTRMLATPRLLRSDEVGVTINGDGIQVAEVLCTDLDRAAILLVVPAPVAHWRLQCMPR